MVKAREQGDVDETRIEDRSREFLGGDSRFNNVEDSLTYTFETFLNSPDNYTRKVWSNQQQYVIIWIEKDALSRVVSEEANKYRVTTCPSRGYASYTYIKEALARLPEDKPFTILHFADHDPSGLDMTRDVANRFFKYSGREMAVERVALNYDQVQHYHLPSNPTKRADPRTENYIAKYGDECWELDAIEPTELQRIVLDAILGHIDRNPWSETVDQILHERQEMRTMFSSIRDLLVELGFYDLSNS